MVQGTPIYPLFPGVLTEDNNLKLNHDRYEIYVNGDFIGYKTLLGQNEEIADIDDFLHEQGVSKFEAAQDGDHYVIQSDHSEQALKDVLSVYLQSR